MARLYRPTKMCCLPENSVNAQSEHQRSSSFVYVSDVHSGQLQRGGTSRAAPSCNSNTPEVVPAALIACDLSTLLGSLCFEEDSNARMCASFRRLVLVSWSQGYSCSWLSLWFSNALITWAMWDLPSEEPSIITDLLPRLSEGAQVSARADSTARQARHTFSQVDSWWRKAATLAAVTGNTGSTTHEGSLAAIWDCSCSNHTR